MPFDDETFDIVTGFETVYFWPDFINDLKEVSRVLKVNGKLFIANEALPKENDERQNELIVLLDMNNNAKDELIKYYQDMAKNDSSVSIKNINNTTVIHFGDENTVGDIEYHDLAIAGDDSQYILIQCDDQDLMNSIAESINFN